MQPPEDIVWVSSSPLLVTCGTRSQRSSCSVMDGPLLAWPLATAACFSMILE
jgi:hypothetical protein